jgi:hypothetical protein
MHIASDTKTCNWPDSAYHGTLKYDATTIYYNNMSQNPQKRNKDSKEVAENNIEQTSSDDKYPATKPLEEVAGQRDTKSADAADSADSMVV